MIICIRTAEDQHNQNSELDGRRAHKALLLSEERLETGICRVNENLSLRGMEPLVARLCSGRWPPTYIYGIHGLLTTLQRNEFEV